MNTASRALISGSLASIAAAVALAACARREGRRAPQPLNATSHWLHGDQAAARGEADLPHTVVGYGTHHAAAVMWAGMFEWMRERSSSDSTAAVVRDAAVTSTVAAAVDYTITPHRFTPGWELVLSKQSMAMAYAAMAAGFVVAEYLLPMRRRV
jgi:hypothetical protein